jgi:hypothetical protein
MVSQEMSFKNMEDFEVQNELDEVETFCGKQQRASFLSRSLLRASFAEKVVHSSSV